MIRQDIVNSLKTTGKAKIPRDEVAKLGFEDPDELKEFCSSIANVYARYYAPSKCWLVELLPDAREQTKKKLQTCLYNTPYCTRLKMIELKELWFSLKLNGSLEAWSTKDGFIYFKIVI
ncbi:26S proteasome regulatory subuniT [Caudoviricetes sp.]|nr:26S proteasome regulatory subuniT [Caudoviricetes sp.]